MAVRAGTLREVVTVQESHETQNEFRETVRVWAPITGTESARRIALRPVTQRDQERLANNETQVQQEPTIIGEMRWWPGLTSKHRLVHGERILEILAVANVGERNRSYELLLREAVDA